MNLPTLPLLTALALLAAPAFADETVPPPTPRPDPSSNVDRLFPLGLPASTHATTWHTDTAGRAQGDGAFRVSQSVELVPVQKLTVGVAMEFRTTSGLTPEATAKYQFLDQATAGVNAAAGLKYKQVGFAADGGEVEGIVSASRQFGPVVALVNGVFGTGLAEPDQDAELFAGVGVRVLKNGFVGLNGQAKFLLGEAAEETEAAGGRTTELLGGAVIGYHLGIVDASLLGGYLSPKGTAPAGPLAMMKLGLSF